METLSASAFPVPPQTQTSHIRSSSHLSSRANPASTTRSVQQGDSQHPPLSAPASQESFVSAQSAVSSVAPRLQSSSSNVSQLTAYTDLTSPTSSAPERIYEQQFATSRPNIACLRTPEGNGENRAFASPMSLTSPVSTNGTKRTASGHVKNAPSLPNTPLTATFAGQRSRAGSLSSTSSRAGELAASLKTRLGYAMAKVELGLEHKSINEIEALASRKIGSPNRHSMSHLDYSSRPLSSDLSNGTARLSVYEGHTPSTLDGTTSPPPKRHSGIYNSFAPASSSQPTLITAPRLQPAPDIRPQQRYYHTAPSSQTSNNYGSAMSPPRTPVNGQQRRPPTIRTDTQTAEAERDALQALFQLGSPHASQVSWRQHNNASQASSSQASPLRSEFTTTPRKVAFARSESERSSSEGSLEGAMAGRA